MRCLSDTVSIFLISKLWNSRIKFFTNIKNYSKCRKCISFYFGYICFFFKFNISPLNQTMCCYPLFYYRQKFVDKKHNKKIEIIILFPSRRHKCSWYIDEATDHRTCRAVTKTASQRIQFGLKYPVSWLNTSCECEIKKPYFSSFIVILKYIHTYTYVSRQDIYNIKYLWIFFKWIFIEMTTWKQANFINIIFLPKHTHIR